MAFRHSHHGRGDQQVQLATDRRGGNSRYIMRDTIAMSPAMTEELRCPPDVYFAGGGLIEQEAEDVAIGFGSQEVDNLINDDHDSPRRQPFVAGHPVPSVRRNVRAMCSV